MCCLCWNNCVLYALKQWLLFIYYSFAFILTTSYVKKPQPPPFYPLIIAKGFYTLAFRHRHYSIVLTRIFINAMQYMFVLDRKTPSTYLRCWAIYASYVIVVCIGPTIGSSSSLIQKADCIRYEKSYNFLYCRSIRTYGLVVVAIRSGSGDMG